MRAIDTSPFIVMLARQRSGTNPLRAVLDRHPEIFCSPEIFHPRPSPETELEVEMNYFEFLERHTEGAIKPVLTSLEAQEQLFLDYLSYLRCFSDKRYVLLDVKYNSTHAVDGPWRAVGREPELFLFIRRHGLRVLNLTRRNHLRYYLSWKKAELTAQWTDESAGRERPVDDPSITVPIEELMFHLAECATESQAVTRSFEGYPQYLELEYEDLFPTFGKPPAPKELRRLAAWLAIEPEFASGRLRHRKQAVLPLAATIENYEEVVAALRGTPHEYCLDDERGYRKTRRRGAARAMAR
jgi:hypothetical protein